MVGEITDETNSADAFALLHAPWASGYAIGYVGIENYVAFSSTFEFSGLLLADG